MDGKQWGSGREAIGGTMGAGAANQKRVNPLMTGSPFESIDLLEA